MQKFLFQKVISHTKASFSTAELSRLGPARLHSFERIHLKARHQPGHISNRHLHHPFIKRNVQSLDFVFLCACSLNGGNYLNSLQRSRTQYILVIFGGCTIFIHMFFHEYKLVRDTIGYWKRTERSQKRSTHVHS
jgi:hypothetical protein